MNVLKPLIDKLIQLIESGVDLVSGQLPDVAKQILKFKTAMAFVWTGFGVLVVVAGVYFWHWLRKHHRADKHSSYCECMGCSWIPFFFGILIGTLLIMVNVSDLLEIWLAPKLYLIEYLRHILRPCQ